MEYFDSLTNHINYEEEKVILNGIWSDSLIKDIIYYLNGNITIILVNNLRKTQLNMSKSKDDRNLKRTWLMMILNSVVHKLNMSIVSKTIGVTRQSIYNTMNRLSSGDEGNSLLKLTIRYKPMMPITLEFKDTITIFWTNDNRVSLNKKDLMYLRHLQSL